MPDASLTTPTRTRTPLSERSLALNGSPSPSPDLIASTNKLSLDDYARDGSATLKHSRSKESMSATTLLSTVAELDMEVAAARIIIFEIQEMRHASAAPTPAEPVKPDAISRVDEALSRLDARLETLSRDVDLLSKQAGLPSHAGDSNLQGRVQGLQEDWQSLQADAELLREELQEDKYLVVFRTVSSQAGSMMDSLDKVLATCQAFIWEIRQRPRSSTSSTSSGEPRGDFDTDDSPEQLLREYRNLHRALTQKRTYYVPSTESVMAILQKGLAQRKTSNGEVLRRYGDMETRWRTLQDRLVRVGREMDGLGESLGDRGDDEASFLAPDRASKPRTSSPTRNPATQPRPSLSAAPTTSTSRSMGSSASPERPLAASQTMSRRQSFVPTTSAFEGGARRSSVSSNTPRLTKTNYGSMAPPSSSSPSKAATPSDGRPRWNSSARSTANDSQSIRRQSSSMGLHASQQRAGGSQANLTNGRQTPLGIRPTSPSGRSSVSGRSVSAAYRPRPSSPSRIPMPGMMDDDEEEPTSLMQRAFSPTPSEARASGPSVVRLKPRSSFSPSAARTRDLRNMLQTPEPSLSAQASRIAGLYGTMPRNTRVSSMNARRSGAVTPAFGQDPQDSDGPYMPNPRDPLDVELAEIVNGQPLRIRVIRVDPPLPKHSTYVNGESFSYSLTGVAKPVQVKLVERMRAGTQTKKLMARVGGSWVDFEGFLLDLQAQL